MLLQYYADDRNHHERSGQDYVLCTPLITQINVNFSNRKSLSSVCSDTCSFAVTALFPLESAARLELSCNYM